MKKIKVCHPNLAINLKAKGIKYSNSTVSSAHGVLDAVYDIL